MLARLWRGASGAHGFEPTEIFVRKLEGLTETVYVESGNSSAPNSQPKLQN